MAKSTCSVDGCDRVMLARTYCDRHYNEFVRMAKPPCTAVDDGVACTRPQHSGELCRIHRQRELRYGRVENMTPEERFWSHVEVTPGCWLWTGGYGLHGYGVYMGAGMTQRQLAHRHAYRLVLGAIPEGYEIDHLCFVRKCVNPAHLEAVTKQENIQRSNARRWHG